MSAHDQLPWYVNGTLDPAESERFERHLAGCDRCAREKPLLEELRGTFGRCGPGSLPDHPEPADLLAGVCPEDADRDLSPEQAAAVRRHLDLCAACRQEVSWLRGEAIAQGTAEGRRGGASFLPAPAAAWLALAAGVVLGIVSGWLWLPAARGPSATGVTRQNLVSSTRRGDQGRATIRPAPGAHSVVLLMEVDLAPGDFPAGLRVTREEGRVVIASREFAAEDLFRGGYLTVECDLRDCAAGDYLALVTPRGGRPPAEYRFRIEAASPAP